jgi:hypothetical protein
MPIPTRRLAAALAVFDGRASIVAMDELETDPARQARRTVRPSP